MITLKMDRHAAEKVLQLLQEHGEEPINIEHENDGSLYVIEELKRLIFLEDFEGRQKI